MMMIRRRDATAPPPSASPAAGAAHAHELAFDAFHFLMLCAARIQKPFCRRVFANARRLPDSHALLFFCHLHRTHPQQRPIITCDIAPPNNPLVVDPRARLSAPTRALGICFWHAQCHLPALRRHLTSPTHNGHITGLASLIQVWVVWRCCCCGARVVPHLAVRRALDALALAIEPDDETMQPSMARLGRR